MVPEEGGRGSATPSAGPSWAPRIAGISRPDPSLAANPQKVFAVCAVSGKPSRCCRPTANSPANRSATTPRTPDAVRAGCSRRCPFTSGHLWRSETQQMLGISAMMLSRDFQVRHTREPGREIPPAGRGPGKDPRNNVAQHSFAWRLGRRNFTLRHTAASYLQIRARKVEMMRAHPASEDTRIIKAAFGQAVGDRVSSEETSGFVPGPSRTRSDVPCISWPPW